MLKTAKDVKENIALKWILKNSKSQWWRILFISMSNILLALVNTGVAVLSKYAIDAAHKSSITKNPVLKDKYFKNSGAKYVC